MRRLSARLWLRTEFERGRTVETLDRQTEDTLRELAERLTPADLDATLNKVTTAAVELLPHVDYASLTVRHRDGTVHSYASTDAILVDLDRTQDELQEGPCYYAITESPHVISRDLRVDPRFPRFGQAAAEVGILSQAGLRLFKTGGAVAALDLYSTQAGAFEELNRLDRLFAHQAATALNYARELDNLHEALPKGMSVETLRLVTECLRAATAPRSATEVAAVVGASRVTTRRYLEHLADSGLATRQARYGQSGRPEVEYRWTR